MFYYDTVIILLLTAIYRKGTGASVSQTSLTNQPKVNKRRLKTQKKQR